MQFSMTFTVKILLIVTLTVLFVISAAAVELPKADQRNVIGTLQTWIQIMHNRHPLLRSLASRIQAQERRSKPAGILPDPVISVAVRNVGNPIPFNTLGDEMMSTAGLVIQQAIPWKGKLKTRRQIEEALRTVLESELQTAFWELAGGLERQSLELAYTQEQLSILRESRDLLDQLIAIAEALYGVGKGTQADVLRAYTERSRLDERIENVQKMADTLVQQIREQYLTDPQAVVPRLTLPETLVELPGESELYGWIDTDAPLIQRIRSRIQWQDQRSRLAYLSRYPDFNLRAGWFSRGRLPDIWEVGIGLNVPIFAGAKQIPLYQAEQADLTALKQQLEDTRYRLRWRLQDALLRARTAQRLVDLYRTEILPQAQADFESTLDNYQTGRLDFLNVMDRWLRWLDFRVGYYRQLANYYQAVAAIEEITGHAILTRVPEAASPKKPATITTGTKTSLLPIQLPKLLEDQK